MPSVAFKRKIGPFQCSSYHDSQRAYSIKYRILNTFDPSAYNIPYIFLGALGASYCPERKFSCLT
jgi:hypothetical protein